MDSVNLKKKNQFMACFASFFGDHAAVKKQTKKQQIK